jgi:hypothetical protein
LARLPANQVELSQELALLRRGDQRGAAIEVIDDIEDGFFVLPPGTFA